MKELPFSKVLALSPHTDDIEFGCGGTIHRLMQQGTEVFTAVFSLCEESVPKGYPKDILLKEMHEAGTKLNIYKDHITVFQYPVRRFTENRQEILENLVELNRKLEPDLVLTPCRTDIHQDHQVICQESVRAFRSQSILGYELPWNNFEFSARAFIQLSSQNLEAKLSAVNCYESQRFRQYSNTDLFQFQAQLRGLLNKTTFSEAFEVIRLTL
ncbi:MAG: PIG-L family deacetylase [Nitrosopumilaceae archaeon]|nr:PIG-L family deacetylase [Nitrosopumilaceae archaeon]NIU88401.1 PIG-L family deacetylase [Nitrosopumilaceae archaeon]NIV66676.1 PIG-L family deacetylase [Nitrosopumilaceae archaeon]NIX62616.1 PIG-L family deacetylase [Nitrosopumilaceae archaeon]